MPTIEWPPNPEPWWIRHPVWDEIPIHAIQPATTYTLPTYSMFQPLTEKDQMGLFHRIDDRHFERALKHKYAAMEAGPDKDAVAHAIADDEGRNILRTQLETNAVPNITAPAPNGILAQLILWLENNWQAILAAILALFKP